jgi:4-hydroxymandelate oxidase
MEPLNLFEFEALAREKLDPMAYDYFAGGAGDEVTLRANRAAFERIRLLPRVLVDVGERDLTTTVLSRPVSFPVLIAPTAFHRLAHPEGELATAKAARDAGTVMVLSSLSTTPMEEVAAVGGERWFQLYVYRDREVTRELVARAEAAGYTALVLTVDAPYLGRRERDVRNSFTLPAGLRVANVAGRGYGGLAREAGTSGLAAYFATMLDPTLTWRDLEWLVAITSLPVVVKGVHRADDAERAVAHGAAAVVVSNHGGRQLDTVPAGIEMLPAVAEAVGGRVEVLVDGGIRRGTDVVKALALGARAVLLGRPVVWGLAVGGAQGVAQVLELLRAELDLALALCGCRSVREVDRGLVAFAPPW